MLHLDERSSGIDHGLRVTDQELVASAWRALTVAGLLATIGFALIFGQTVEVLVVLVAATTLLAAPLLLGSMGSAKRRATVSASGSQRDTAGYFSTHVH